MTLQLFPGSISPLAILPSGIYGLTLPVPPPRELVSRFPLEILCETVSSLTKVRVVPGIVETLLGV